MHRLDPTVMAPPTDGALEGFAWGTLDPAWEGVTTRWRNVLGNPVRTLTYEGPDAATEGTPQLLIHGLGGSATNWIEVMAQMGRHAPVVAPDLPGFGLTPVPPGGSARIHANAGFVRALRRELGWDTLELFGNSMGGMIALLVASAHPEGIERLVLVDPAVPGDPRRSRELDAAVIARFAPFVIPGLGYLAARAAWQRTPVEQMLDDSLALVFADPSSMRLPLRIIRLADIEFGKANGWRVRALSDAAQSLVALVMGRRRMLAAIDAITAPTLLIWGDQDRLVGRAAVDVVRARRPDWEIAVLPGVGHAPMVEGPAAFLAAVEGTR